MAVVAECSIAEEGCDTVSLLRSMIRLLLHVLLVVVVIVLAAVVA